MLTILLLAQLTLPVTRVENGVLLRCQVDCRPFESATDGVPPASFVNPEPLPPLTWATTLAVAGPLADGLSTWYALRQSGPHAQAVESNRFFHRMFGSNVTGGEILAFKVGQAALTGAAVYYASRGRHTREQAWLLTAVSVGLHGYITTQNLRVAQHVKRLNGY